MADQNGSHRQFAELLWIEINKAILSSKSVRNSIRRLKSLNMLQHISKYDLVLDIEKLIQLAQKEDGNPSAEAAEESAFRLPEDAVREHGESAMAAEEALQNLAEIPADKGPSKGGACPAQRVDGKTLSSSEVLYLKYLESSFDEELWMRQVKIRLE